MKDNNELKSEILSLVEKITIDNFLQSKLKAHFEQYSENFDTQQNELNKYIHESKILNPQLVELETENKGMKEKLRTEETNLKSLIEDNDEQLKTADNKIATLESIVVQLQKDKDTLRTTIDDLNDKVQILENEKETREETLKSLEIVIENLKQKDHINETEYDTDNDEHHSSFEFSNLEPFTFGNLGKNILEELNELKDTFTPAKNNGPVKEIIKQKYSDPRRQSHGQQLTNEHHQRLNVEQQSNEHNQRRHSDAQRRSNDETDSPPDEASPPSLSVNFTPSSSTEDDKVCYVFGDSHCRDLGPIIRKLDSNINVSCNVYPGQKLDFIVNTIKTQKLSPKSKLCLIAGTNDLFSTKFECIKFSIDKLITKCKHLSLFIMLIPPRYDQKGMNKHVRNLNVKIKHHVSTHNNVQCIDPVNFISFSHLNNDGIHLNKRGKSVLCSKLINKMFNLQVLTPSTYIKGSNISKPKKNRYVSKEKNNVHKNKSVRREYKRGQGTSTLSHTAASQPLLECHTPSAPLQRTFSGTSTFNSNQRIPYIPYSNLSLPFQSHPYTHNQFSPFGIPPSHYSSMHGSHGPHPQNEFSPPLRSDLSMTTSHGTFPQNTLSPSPHTHSSSMLGSLGPPPQNTFSPPLSTHYTLGSHGPPPINTLSPPLPNHYSIPGSHGPPSQNIFSPPLPTHPMLSSHGPPSQNTTSPPLLTNSIFGSHGPQSPPQNTISPHPLTHSMLSAHIPPPLLSNYSIPGPHVPIYQHHTTQNHSAQNGNQCFNDVISDPSRFC